MKCIEDEIPFDVPERWSWCRYSDVIELYSGQDLTPDRYNDVGDGIPYITGASNLVSEKVLINRWTSTPTTHATKDDLLLTVKGSGVGKMAFCDITDAHIARQIMALRCTKVIKPQYLYIVISSMLSDIIAQANGIIPGIRREIVLGTLLPLPPLREQEPQLRLFSTLSINANTDCILAHIAFCSLPGGTGYNHPSIFSLLMDGELSPFIYWFKPSTTYPEIIK